MRWRDVWWAITHPLEFLLLLAFALLLVDHWDRQLGAEYEARWRCATK